MGCRIFFDANRENSQKCKELQKIEIDKLADWEDQTASEFSPSVVHDGEILYQQIVDPTHLEPDGRNLKPTAFQDSANKGMSTHRAEHIEWDELIELGKKRASDFNTTNPERPKRSLWGFAKFLTEDVRRIVAEPEGGRHYFVYDTANESDKSHADICQGVAGNKIVERAIRASLFDLAKGALIKLEDSLDVANNDPMSAALADAA
ncbi:hypothetical protein [Janthinobacterium sp. HLS12-2]|uniref:hypothetical protein n=1 Tax=Janthinobacterium sp. HLS12-2 TaxID=1259324 RepID=UPI003F26625B